jgi:FdhD protein
MDIGMAPQAADWHLVEATRLDGAFPGTCAVAAETPVTFAYHDIPHAVMMASPTDLEDFAVGFSLTEGIALQADHVRQVTRTGDAAIRLDIALHPESLRHFLASRRVRNRPGHGGCGICGVEDFSSFAVPARANTAVARVDPAAILRALDGLHDRQPLSQRTKGAHAAAFVTPDGEIAVLREDIGRHNAMDKLVGAVLCGGIDPAAGFGLITSRCSVELVQKAVVAGLRTLVAVSAPTSLAIDWARKSGLTLIAAARHGGGSVFTGGLPD